MFRSGMYNNTVANQRLWYAESGTVRVVEKKIVHRILSYRTQIKVEDSNYALKDRVKPSVSEKL